MEVVQIYHLLYYQIWKCFLVLLVVAQPEFNASFKVENTNCHYVCLDKLVGTKKNWYSKKQYKEKDFKRFEL